MHLVLLIVIFPFYARIFTEYGERKCAGPLDGFYFQTKRKTLLNLKHVVPEPRGFLPRAIKAITYVGNFRAVPEFAYKDNAVLEPLLGALQDECPGRVINSKLGNTLRPYSGWYYGNEWSSQRRK